MLKLRGEKIFFTVILILALAALFLLLPSQTAVAVEGETGTNYLPCKIGDVMVFEFEHSMYHVPQREYFIVKADGLTLDHIYFGNARAACYYDAWDVYVYSEAGDGGYEILDMDLFYPELLFALAHGTSYTLTIGELCFDFNEKLQDSIHYRLYPTQISRLKLLLGE